MASEFYKRVASEFYTGMGEIIFPSGVVGMDITYTEDGEWVTILKEPTVQLVQAQFTPGGKKYTYNCPGAEVGDIITGPGATGPATVVEMGKTISGYSGPIKTATILQKRRNIMGNLKRDETSFNRYIIEVEDGDLVASLEKALEKAKELKAEQEKADAAHLAREEEKARLRKVAMDALEVNAAGGDTQAAIELLKLNK